MKEFPSVRPIEAVPIEWQGQKMVALSDPARYSESSLVVSIPAFFILTLMDGKRDVEHIQEEFQNRYSQQVSKEDIAGLISQMDDALFLDNDRFARYKDSVREKFLSGQTRPAALAGRSYPDDPNELAAILDEALEHAPEPEGAPPKAIIVPHIDFTVGADMMAAGWKAISKSGADLFIILGIGHTLADDFFSFLNKDFDTPAGLMRVDRTFLEKFAQNFGEDIYAQAEAHRNEHSVEFQALFMAHMFNGREDVTAVPLLLSFPETMWEADHPVFNGERLTKFIKALEKTVRDSGRKVAYVASVDFSHVGARFGDGEALNDEDLKRIESDDMELIETIGRMDDDNFLEKIKTVNPVNRVCGFPALYTLLRALGEGRGELLEYRQNLEGKRETVVSFATMVIK